MTNVNTRSQFTEFLKVQKPLTASPLHTQKDGQATTSLPTYVGVRRKPVNIEYIIKELPLY